MKKIVVLLCVALLTCCFAFAEGNSIPMQVVNCEEWVSLRREADRDSERLAKVALGEIVDVVSVGDDFAYCSYRGTDGYILKYYLEGIPQYATGFGEYYDNFSVENGKMFFRDMNSTAGRELLRNIRTEAGEIDGTYSAVADIADVQNGRIEIWEGGYLLISTDVRDRSNPVIETLYSEAAARFVTGDGKIASDMYEDLVRAFENDYRKDPDTDYLFVERYDRIGRYVGVLEGDDGMEYWAFMGEIQ